MFTLKNKEGNAYRNVDSEVKKAALLKEGWVLAEEESPLPPDGDIPPLGKGGEDAADEVKTPSVTADAATPLSEREATDGEDDATASTAPVSEPEPPNVTDGEDDAAASTAPVSEPEPPKAPKNKRQSAGAAKNAASKAAKKE